MRLPLPALAATLLTLSGCASFPPGAAVQAKGYDGPPLPEWAVATVFVLDARPRYEAGFICAVDARPLPSGGCASIVYLQGGVHRLQIRYLSSTESGSGDIVVAVEPGRIYQINATSFRTQGRGMISLVPMPKGSALTFRNVAPSQFSGPKLDQPVPYPGP